MGDRLQVGKPSWYVANHPGQLSLAIPSCVGAMITSESLDVNRHTARCTSPVSVVWQCKLVSGWGLMKLRSAPLYGPYGSGRTLRFSCAALSPLWLSGSILSGRLRSLIAVGCLWCMSVGVRSLPSWQNLKPPMSPHGQLDEDLVEPPQMSDDDLYLMNSKESSVLTSNLLTTESSELQLDIISDPANLRALCNLCESMVTWLGGVTVRTLDLRLRGRGFDFRWGRYQLVTTCIGDCLQAGKLSWYITGH